MTVSELKQKLELERQIMALLEKLPKDMFKANRIACQAGRVNDLDTLVKKLAEELPQPCQPGSMDPLPPIEPDRGPILG